MKLTRYSECQETIPFKIIIYTKMNRIESALKFSLLNEISATNLKVHVVPWVTMQLELVFRSVHKKE